jgi:hypothetical protein
VLKKIVYYIVLIFNKLDNLSEDTNRVIRHIKRLMEALTKLNSFMNSLHEKILTNVLDLTRYKRNTFLDWIISLSSSHH